MPGFSSDNRQFEDIVLDLSVVIPAFNEAHRIDESLDAVLAYVTELPLNTEVIVVDDGSTDDTLEIARRFADQHPGIQVIPIDHGGKAIAVRVGLLAAQGNEVLFSDVDLATPLSELMPLRERLAQGCDLAIASREGVGARRLDEPAYRHVMGRVFNLIVRLLLLPGIQDTQCGFKLFRRDAIRNILSRTLLYPESHGRVTGARVTAFDVELLVIARRHGYRICEVPVVWTAGEGSKVNPIRDTWRNLRDVIQVFMNDRRGRYQ